MRRDVKPLFLKAGFALLLSLAGFFASRHRRLPHLPSLHPSSDASPAALETSCEIDDELPNNQSNGASAKVSPRAHVTFEEDQSSSSGSSGEEEELHGFLLSEFTNVVQLAPEASPETMPPAPLTEKFEIKDIAAMEEEMRYLRNLVQSLQRRERCLEIQLLEYHGLREQEISMGELLNRLKLSAMETKLLMLKIESLTAENEKLRAEASDYSGVASELELERRNIMLLKTKLKSVGEHAKEKIAALHVRITELREKERKDLEDAVEIEKKIKRLTELENKVMEFKKENLRLVQEKLEVETKLKSERIIGPSVIRSLDSVLKSSESESFDDHHLLREENDRLKHAIEQLQMDRCADVEELVYLRWVNACLRYEMRKYRPPPGRTLARDLSRCLSPRSEEKVKQLILEYSNSDFILNHASLMEVDFEDCTSQASSGESGETSLGSSMTKSSRSKFLGMLKKVVLGKGYQVNKLSRTPGSDENSERRASVSTCTFEEMASCFSVEQAKGNNSAEIQFSDLSRYSLDIDNLREFRMEEAKGGLTERCKSDLGAVYGPKSVIPFEHNFTGSNCSSLTDIEVGEAPEKMKLKKFAEVFKGSKGDMKPKRRSASLSFA